MPIDAICPSCQKKLKVPDSLASKKVRCPKCNSVFMAEHEEEEVEMELVEEPPQDNTEVVEGPAPRKRAQREPDVEEIDEEIEEIDEETEEEPRERRRPRRRKRRRGSAREQLRIPALLLQIVGYGGGAISVLWVVFRIVITLIEPTPIPRGVDASAYKGGVAVGAVCVGVVQLCITLAWSGVIIKGAHSMSSLNGYSSAVAACILAMLPCSCGCFMGLPIGIWGLVVLTQDNVKRAFS
jgi:predicted Zn finger-like uncharacterized protein